MKKNIIFNHISCPSTLVLCLVPMTVFASEAAELPVIKTEVVQHQVLTPMQIESKLADMAWSSADFTTTGNISVLDSPQVPVGLDVEAMTQLPNYEHVVAQNVISANEGGGINPDAYIPEYQYEPQHAIEETEIAVDKPRGPNVVKRLYNRLFNDGVETVERLKVNLYYGGQMEVKNTQTVPNDKNVREQTTNAKVSENATKVERKMLQNEPFANIKATLEEITVESVMDYQASIARIRQAVVAAARAVGYYDVYFSIEKAGVGEVNVIIHDLGEPVTVATQVLEVRGIGITDNAYEQAISTAPLKEGDVLHHGKYEMTKSQITDVSGEHGYFDGRWLSNAVDVVLPDNVADVNLVYDSGVQYQFDDVVFFTLDPETKQLTTDPDKLPVKPEILKKLMTFNMGDAYNRTAARNLSNNLLATGYFNTVNTEVILPNPAKSTNVNFETDTKQQESTNDGSEYIELGDGVSATIAPIEFTASQAIGDKLELVAAKAERLYNAPEDRLLVINSTRESKSILGRISDAVSSIAKIILPDESDDVLPELSEGAELPVLTGKKTEQAVYDDKKVPLYIFVMSDKPRDAQIGVGWGSDTGTRVVAKIEHNLLTRDGVQAGADLRLSQSTKDAQLYITRPWSHPLNDKLKASLSYQEERIDQGNSFDLSSKTLETGISRNILKENGWNRNYSLRYRLDKLKTNAPPDTWKDLPVQFAEGQPIQKAVLAGFAANKTVADNLLNPMRGYRQYYSVEAGSKSLMTDTNMAILRAGVSGVYSFGDNHYGQNRQHQLLGSLNVGYIWADDFNAVPYKLRFFAGGDQSIRGYNYQSLSPISDKGYLTGGQALAVGSLEYNYEVMEGLRLGMFADVGNAYDKNFSNDTKIGAGVGVRYASPVGQVRVDVATGVGEQDKSIKLHFFVGTPF